MASCPILAPAGSEPKGGFAITASLGPTELRRAGPSTTQRTPCRNIEKARGEVFEGIAVAWAQIELIRLYSEDLGLDK